MDEIPLEISKQVPSWKRRGYEPYLVQIESCPQLFVIKTLSRKEYSELVESADFKDYYGLSPMKGIEWPTQIVRDTCPTHMAEVIKTVLLWPQHLSEDLPACTDHFIFKAAISVSGWVNPESLEQGLEASRMYVQSLQGFLEAKVLQSFPHMKLEEIEALTFERFIKLVAISESITGMKVDLRPWLHPEEFEREMDKLKKKQRNSKAFEMQKAIETGQSAKARMEIMQNYLLQIASSDPPDTKKDYGKVNFARENEGLNSI